MMLKALVIDDDSPNLQLMAAMLSHYNYDVYTNERGDQGIEMAIKIHPDVIFLDLLMPKTTYDGMEVVRLLRDMPQFQTTPVVAISAADTETINEILNSGLFTDFLQKPINRDGLIALLTRLNLLDIA